MGARCRARFCECPTRETGCGPEGEEGFEGDVEAGGDDGEGVEGGEEGGGEEGGGEALAGFGGGEDEADQGEG